MSAMAAELSLLRDMGEPSCNPISSRCIFRYRASFADSEAAMISASHDDRATVFCFLLPQEMAAEPYWNTQPEVEWRTAQSESVMPEAFRRSAWKHRPRSWVVRKYISTRSASARRSVVGRAVTRLSWPTE